MKHLLTTLLLFLSAIAFAQTDTASAPSLNQQHEMEKAIGISKQRMSNAGLMHIIGGSSMGLGMGAMFIHLDKRDAESKYAMYSFLGLGVSFNIAAGGMHMAAAKKLR